MRRGSIAFAPVIALVVLSASSACSTKASRPPATPTAPESIGVATMDADGTILFDLRATEAGALGDARLRYPKGHPEYDAILEHLGGLRPGETKPVPPWPDPR